MRVFKINNFPRFIQNIHEFYAIYTVFGPKENTWFGLPTVTLPTDFWVYQEIISEQRPDIIIQTGSYSEASVLYFNMVCKLIGHGQAIESKKIFKLTKNKKVMVILGTTKDKNELQKELATYSPIVPLGGYIIIENTTVQERREAVDEFLLKNQSFKKDYLCEKFMLTHNPGGFLKRKSKIYQL